MAPNSNDPQLPLDISHVAARSKRARPNVALHFWSQRRPLDTEIFTVPRGIRTGPHVGALEQLVRDSSLSGGACGRHCLCGGSRWRCCAGGSGGRTELISPRTPLVLLLISLNAIAAVWWWLAIPINLARAPIDPNAKLQCLSYAPFRSHQTSLSPATQVTREQIAEDLAQLAKVSDCVRTYANDLGLDQIPELAAKEGLKVIQGIWLSGDRQKNLSQISTGVRLAKEYPETIIALVVGNEVLLHGNMTASDLAATIRSVKKQVAVPVTYADVWEFWSRNRELGDSVDFVTIHILPFWENAPVRAKFAAAHVDAVRKQMASQFPGKEILIGET